MYEIADCHNDLLVAVRHLRERGHSDPFGDFWLPQLLSGGVRFQVLPVFTEDQFVGEGALRRCLLLIEEARRFAELHSSTVAIAESGAQLRKILSSGRIALLLAIEGAEPIGNSLELLDVMRREGVRMCSLSWNRRTMMADGTAEQDTGGRLTRLGVEAVGRLEDLGIVVDVSHLSEAGFFHLAEVAERPFIASHSSCRSLVDHPRNLTDRQLDTIRQSRGFVALNAFGPFVSNDTPSVDRYLDHVEHAVSRLGVDNVGLGPDFTEDLSRIVDPVFTGALTDPEATRSTPGLQRPADFTGLAQATETRFGPEVARKVLGSNLVNFIADALD